MQLKVPANVWSWIGQHKLDHVKLDTGPFTVTGTFGFVFTKSRHTAGASPGRHRCNFMVCYICEKQNAGLLLPAAFHRGSGQDSAVELQAGLRETAASEAAESDPSRIRHLISCIVYAFNQPEHLGDSDRCNKLLTQVCGPSPGISCTATACCHLKRSTVQVSGKNYHLKLNAVQLPGNIDVSKARERALSVV